MACLEGTLKLARLISGRRDPGLSGFVSLLDSKTGASVIELHGVDTMA